MLNLDNISTLNKKAISLTTDHLRKEMLSTYIEQKKTYLPDTPKMKRIIYLIRIKARCLDCVLNPSFLGDTFYIGQERTIDDFLSSRLPKHLAKWSSFLLPGYEENGCDYTWKMTDEKDYWQCTCEDELESTLKIVEFCLKYYIATGKASHVIGPYESHSCKLFNYPDSNRLPTYITLFETYRATLIKDGMDTL